MSGNSTQSDAAAALIERMNSIRNVSEVHVAGLHDQAQRLADWREHVRAWPIASVALAGFSGYALVSSVSGRSSRSGGAIYSRESSGSREAQQDAQTATTASAAGISSGLMAFVGSLASAAVRQYAMQTIRKRFGE